MLDITSEVTDWTMMVPYGAGLAALLGSALLGRHVVARPEACTSFSRWAKYGADLSKAKSGIKTVFEFVEFVMDEVKSFIYARFPSLGVRSTTVRHFLDRYNFDIRDFVKEAMAVTDPLNKEKVLASPDSRLKLEKLLNEASIVSIDVAGGEVTPSAGVAATLREVRQRLLKFAETFDTLDSTSVTRFTPYVVALYGEPGCGKSVACDLFAKAISDPRYCTVPLDHENLIYARSGSDKYWSLYNGQPIIVLDDFGQKNGCQPNESEFIEFINMVSAVPWSVSMAAVEDKGKRFRGKAVILTTNTPYPRPNEVVCNDAIWRRRNVLIEVKKVTSKGGIPDPMKDCNYSFVDPMARETGSYLKARLTSGEMIELKDLSFVEACEYIVPRFNKYWDDYINSESRKVVPELNVNKFHAQSQSLPIGGHSHEEVDVSEQPLIAEEEDGWSPLGIPPEEEDLTEILRPSQRVFEITLNHTEVNENNVCCGNVNPAADGDRVLRWCGGMGRFFYPDGRMAPLVRNQFGDELYYLEWMAVWSYAKMGFYKGRINVRNPFWPMVRGFWRHQEDVSLTQALYLFDYWRCEAQEPRIHAQMWQDEDLSHLEYGFDAEITAEEEKALEEFDSAKDCPPESKKVVKVLKILGAIGTAFAAAAAAQCLKKMLWSGSAAQVGPSGKLIEKTVQAYPANLREQVGGFLIDMAAEAARVNLNSHLFGEGGSKGSGDHRTMYATKKPIRVYKPEGEYNPLPNWTNMMVAEGTKDKNSIDFTRYKLPKNLVRLHTIINGRAVAICGLALKDRTIMVPYHFVHVFKKQSYPTMVQTIFDDFREEIDYGKATRLIHNGEPMDLALLTLSMRVPSFPDITSNFIDDVEVDRLTRTEGMLVRLGETRGVRFALEMTNLEVVAETEMEQTYPADDIEYRLLRSFSYRGNTQDGDCGAALVAINPHTRGKIFGFHIAGNDMGLGVSVPLSQGIIRHALEGIKAQGMVRRIIPDIIKPMEVEEIEAEAKIRPTGTLRVVGIVQPEYGQRMPLKTDIKPSLIHGLVTKPTTAPSVLTPSDPRVDEEIRKAGFSPLEAGINKYSVPTNPFPRKDLEIARQVISSKLNCYSPSGMTRRLLTTKEAINGVPTAGYMRINMGTSPGMPFKNWRAPGMKGKHFMFREVGKESDEVIYDFDLDYVYKGKRAGQILKDTYERNDQNIRNGVMPDWYYYTNLKQERRKFSKIRIGSTRTFECAPLDQTLLFRKYFGAFIATMNQNCAELPSSVGIDPEGPNWSALYRRLNKFGGKVLAGDYKEWDGKLPGDVQEIALQIINDWYNDSDENKLARRVLIESSIHALLLCIDVLVQKVQGIPSGIPLTADLNGLCNWIYMICALLELARRNNFPIVVEEILSLFEAAFYGDDHVVAPHPSIQHFFTFHNIRDFFKEMGITYTDALKTGTDPLPLEPLTQVTYLKRRFVPNEDFPDKIMAPIEMETIDEEINWIRESADDLDATLQNIYAAKLHLVQHGRTMFEQKLSKINDAICAKRADDLQFSKSSRWEEVSIDYDNELQNWLNKFY